MTREEAKGMIKHSLEVIPKEPPTECDYIEEWFQEDKRIRKSLDMAIKALEQQDVLFKSGLLKDCEACRAEQQPCEDAISRQAALEIVADYNLSMGEVVKGIHALPSVTPKPMPKTGHWIDLPFSFECSECGIIRAKGTSGKYNFCPNCGCRMVKPQESEE